MGDKLLLRAVAELGGGPNGAAIGLDGKCYVCNNDGFEFGRGSDGLVRPIRGADDYSSGRIERVDLDSGNIEAYGRQMERAVYYARADGSLIREAVHPIITPNGISLAPDVRTLYVAKTETSRPWSFEIVCAGELKKLPLPSPHSCPKQVSGIHFRVLAPPRTP